MNARFAFNTLAVCGAAGFAGAMLVIGLSFGAYWKGLPPAAFLDWFGANGFLIGRAIPVFAVPTAIGLAASLWFDRREPEARRFWLAAVARMAALGLVTAAFHLPLNAAFAAKAVPLDQVPAALDRWLWLHAVRIALGLGCAALGMAAARASWRAPQTPSGSAPRTGRARATA